MDVRRLKELLSDGHIQLPVGHHVFLGPAGLRPRAFGILPECGQRGARCGAHEDVCLWCAHVQKELQRVHLAIARVLD